MFVECNGFKLKVFAASADLCKLERGMDCDGCCCAKHMDASLAILFQNGNLDRDLCTTFFEGSEVEFEDLLNLNQLLKEFVSFSELHESVQDILEVLERFRVATVFVIVLCDDYQSTEGVFVTDDGAFIENGEDFQVVLNPVAMGPLIFQAHFAKLVERCNGDSMACSIECPIAD